MIISILLCMSVIINILLCLQVLVGEEMKARASKLAGGEVSVGDVVQVTINDKDRARVDPPNATMVSTVVDNLLYNYE